MPPTMLAARAYRGEQFPRLEEVPVPEITDDEVLVRVRAAGLTHGLLAMWYFTDRIPILPTTLGHEIAGEVAALGRGVTGLAEGDRVRVHTSLTCGRCRFCRSDQECLCPSLGIIGYALYGEPGRPAYQRYHDGGHAQYVRVPAANIDRLPDDIPFEVAAKVGTLAGSFRAVKMSAVGYGGTLVVTGATGGSGMAAVLCAELVGATRVLAVARDPDSLARTQKLAPGLVCTVATGELPDGWEQGELLTEALRASGPADGPDGMVDFVPVTSATTVQALYALRKGGCAVLMAGNQVTLPLGYGRLMQNQWSVRGARGVIRRDEWEIIALLRAGRLAVEPLVTHRFPLEKMRDAVSCVFDRAEHPIFVIVEP